MSKQKSYFENNNCGPSLKYGYIPCNDTKHINPKLFQTMSVEEINRLDPSQVGVYMKMYTDGDYYDKLGNTPQERSAKSIAISNLISSKRFKKTNEQISKYNDSKPYFDTNAADNPDERERGGKRTRRKGRKSRRKGRKSRRKSRK